MILTQTEETIEIKYSKLVENSICPPNVDCIWQGRLVIVLEINKKMNTLGLGDSGSLAKDSIPNTAMYQDYEIELLGENEHFITIVVDKKLLQ